jgi:hypothetical protein
VAGRDGVGRRRFAAELLGLPGGRGGGGWLGGVKGCRRVGPRKARAKMPVPPPAAGLPKVSQGPAVLLIRPGLAARAVSGGPPLGSRTSVCCVCVCEREREREKERERERERERLHWIAAQGQAGPAPRRP